MKKLTNEEKIKRLKSRKILKFLIIIFGLLTLTLSIYSLITKRTPIFALLCFIIEFILSKYRNKLELTETNQK